MGDRKQVIILGGGFGGLYTALHLEQELGRDAAVDVTLINRENFTLFTPMLHEVAASDVELTHIVNPIRKMVKRTRFIEGEVRAIDLQQRQVVVGHGTRDQHEHQFPYDHLVLALGAVTNYFRLPGAENTVTMKSLGDAIHLRNRLIQHLEEADCECSPHMRQPLLTFVVAGGGFAGVETIAGVNDFVRDALPFYPNLKESDIRVILVHPGEYILPELGESLGTYTRKKLEERKVEVLVGTKVTAYEDDKVLLSDGKAIDSHLLVWTAGTSPSPLVAALPVDKDRGRVKVNEYMEVPQHLGLWALGDCAAVPDPDGKPYPPTAQHAIRMAAVLAHNIAAALRGGEKRKFVFKIIGLLAAIGKRTGVAQILGYNFSGFLAWWMWRTIYLSKLPRMEKKVRVALDWSLDLVFNKDFVQFMTERAPSVSHHEEEEIDRELQAAGVPAVHPSEASP